MSVSPGSTVSLSRQSGVSLIEVLVAAVVLSIGFLGYAALQVVGVRTSDESLYRTQALILADSMAERMYANRSAINDPLVNGGASLYAGLSSADIDCGAPPPRCDRTADAAPANCNVNQIVAFDAFTVFCGTEGPGGVREGGIFNLLPEGTLDIRCTGAGVCQPTDSHLIVVTWEEVSTSGDDDFTTRTLNLELVP